MYYIIKFGRFFYELERIMKILMKEIENHLFKKNQQHHCKEKSINKRQYWNFAHQF